MCARHALTRKHTLKRAQGGRVAPPKILGPSRSSPPNLGPGFNTTSPRHLGPRPRGHWVFARRLALLPHTARTSSNTGRRATRGRTMTRACPVVAPAGNPRFSTWTRSRSTTKAAAPATAMRLQVRSTGSAAGGDPRQSCLVQWDSAIQGRRVRVEREGRADDLLSLRP